MMKLLRMFIAAIFTGAGILHFTNESGFRKIVPHYLPLRKTAVLITGVFEIIFGLTLFIRRPGQTMKKAMNAFLLAVFPANIYMARKQVPLGDLHLPKWILYARLPLQFVLMKIIKAL